MYGVLALLICFADITKQSLFEAPLNQVINVRDFGTPVRRSSIGNLSCRSRNIFAIFVGWFLQDRVMKRLLHEKGILFGL